MVQWKTASMSRGSDRSISKVCTYFLLLLVTCSEVIAQQAEHPLGEDTGSEQVVTVVIHCELGLDLRDKTHTGRQYA